MICVLCERQRSGEEHVSKQTYGGADDSCAEAGGSGAQGGRCSAGVWRLEAHDVCVEGEVRRHGRHVGAEAKQLRDENNRLRKLVADLSLDNQSA